ncbi:hypothetical protein BpHYR1_017820 [Brachionus plicatilis]|uniref:Uncharacterized protein n=1 Tax=Brachionus plicatilis TaxID=10195 RepID=A0A3M7RM50_BRAPC|nr:hypothetical protein BpHYR1_017820 [Brachionus plicatilis]
MSLESSDETLSFRDEQVRSNLLKLIELKLELIDLENLKSQKSFIKNSNILESLKKLESYHEKKLQTFKNRILFFENYLINNLNKTKTATRIANSNRLLCKEMSERKELLRTEIESLKERTNILKKKLEKYQKYYDFIQESLTLFSVHQFTDLPQIINRYKSLKLILDENQNILDQNSDNLVSLKADLHNSIRGHSDSLLYLYASKSRTEQEIKNICLTTTIENEFNSKNLQTTIDRLKEFDLIMKSVDTLYQMSINFSKIYKDRMKSLKPNLDITSEKQLIFDKLAILKENMIYLNEVSK